MRSLKQSNGVKSSNTGSASRIGTNRRHSLSTADRVVTSAGSWALPFRNRGSRLSAGVSVGSADSTGTTHNIGTTGTGRGSNPARCRRSLDKVCLCLHLRT